MKPVKIPGRHRPRWVLFHGTSSRRLKGILSENRLRKSSGGRKWDRKVALTLELSVAQYFACNATFGDLHSQPNEEIDPVVLKLDGEGLIEFWYDLEGFSDPVWGEGDCDWENEIIVE